MCAEHDASLACECEHIEAAAIDILPLDPVSERGKVPRKEFPDLALRTGHGRYLHQLFCQLKWIHERGFLAADDADYADGAAKKRSDRGPICVIRVICG
jgi:hypothetical protein